MNLKPWTEVFDTIAQDTVLTLFQSFPLTSNSSRTIRWTVNGEQMAEWLGCSQSHPVNFEGKVVTLPGQKPSVYAWAKIEICHIKYDKKGKILTMRFQTYLSGTGIPDENGNPQYTY